MLATAEDGAEGASVKVLHGPERGTPPNRQMAFATAARPPGPATTGSQPAHFAGAGDAAEQPAIEGNKGVRTLCFACSFDSFSGRTLGRPPRDEVLSRAHCRARFARIQASVIRNGWPRCTQRRSDSSSASVCRLIHVAASIAPATANGPVRSAADLQQVRGVSPNCPITTLRHGLTKPARNALRFHIAADSEIMVVPPRSERFVPTLIQIARLPNLGNGRASAEYASSVNQWTKS